jgi:hypothetical protein
MARGPWGPQRRGRRYVRSPPRSRARSTAGTDTALRREGGAAAGRTPTSQRPLTGGVQILIVMRRRYFGGTGQHMAMRSGPCMRKPCMTSLGRSQIVAAPGPEGCGTTELPSRQPRPLRASGTAGCAPSVAALAVCVAREAWLTPKPRQNDARSHRGVGLIIKTLALFTSAAPASTFARTTYAGDRADVRITPGSAASGALMKRAKRAQGCRLSAASRCSAVSAAGAGGRGQSSQAKYRYSAVDAPMNAANARNGRVPNRLRDKKLARAARTHTGPPRSATGKTNLKEPPRQTLEIRRWRLHVGNVQEGVDIHPRRGNSPT